jgi:hypothetical protein
MQSVARAFKNHLQIELKRSTDTDNIVFGQASRHVIAHAGGIVDDKMARQISGASLRTLKSKVAPLVAIQFEPSEVRLLAVSMKTYIDTVAGLLNAASSRWSSHSG